MVFNHMHVPKIVQQWMSVMPAKMSILEKHWKSPGGWRNKLKVP